MVHMGAHVRASDPDVSDAYSGVHSKRLQHSAATLAARPVPPCPARGGPATLLSAPRPRTGTRRSGEVLADGAQVALRELQSGITPHLIARRLVLGGPQGSSSAAPSRPSRDG